MAPIKIGSLLYIKDFASSALVSVNDCLIVCHHHGRVVWQRNGSVHRVPQLSSVHTFREHAITRPVGRFLALIHYQILIIRADIQVTLTVPGAALLVACGELAAVVLTCRHVLLLGLQEPMILALGVLVAGRAGGRSRLER